MNTLNVPDCAGHWGTNEEGGLPRNVKSWGGEGVVKASLSLFSNATLGETP